MAAARTKAQALRILDGIEAITRNEMLRFGEYVSHDRDKSKAGSICQGHHVCLVGSAWVAAGVKPEALAYGGFKLPGIFGRDAFLQQRHGLRLAYDALNEVAESRIAGLSKWRQSQVRGWTGEGSAAEDYFEWLADKAGGTTPAVRRKVLDAVDAARKVVESK